MITAPLLAVSAVTVPETRIVLRSRHASHLADRFDAMPGRLAFAVIPFNADQADAAFDGFRRYGKARGHPAQLNICDCAAYALAKTRKEPLLFKGNDFARTDILAAI